MKLQRSIAIAIAATISCALAGTAWAAGAQHDHARDHAPAHGGVVVESAHQDFELVAKPTSLQLYVRSLGNPVDVAKASAKLTLLSGAEKQEVQLKPAGGNKFEAVGTFKVGPGTKAVAVVTIDGRPATARFSWK